MRRISVLFAVSLLAVCLSSKQSYAGWEYTFSKSNLGSGGSTTVGSFGTIVIDDSTTLGTLTSTQVRLSFSMTDGTTDKIFFNSYLSTSLLQAATYTSPTGWSPAANPPVQADGFGQFTFSVGGQMKNKVSSGSIIIDLGAGHASDAVISNFVTWSLNGDPTRAPALFAAEYAPSDGGATGFVGAYDVNPAPAPPGLLLAGSGALVLGLGGFIRRRR